MNVIVFDTVDYGPIEITSATAGGIFTDWTGTAYFKRDDIEVTVNKDGTFRSVYGLEFQVFSGKTHASLTVHRPTIISQIKLGC